MPKTVAELEDEYRHAAMIALESVGQHDRDEHVRVRDEIKRELDKARSVVGQDSADSSSAQNDSPT